MGLLAQAQMPTLVVLIALGLSIGLLLWRSHRYLARQDKDRSPVVRTPRPKPGEHGFRRDAPDDVIRWEVQMHETARDLSGQLDSKMGVLGHLIREADRAAARLEAALEAARHPAARPLAPGATTGQPSDSPQRPEPLPLRPTNQAEALKSAGAAGQGGTPSGGPNGDSEQRPSMEHRYEEIYLLADYGFDAPEIARRVGSPVGEVELILGLRRK